MLYPDGYQIPLLASEQLAHGTKVFHFERPPAFAFRPGQFVSMYVPGIEDEENPDHERAFSIASAPGSARLSFAMRMRDSAFKRALDALQPGQLVEISAPMGEFVLPEPRSRPTVMLAGGIGITPFYSMLCHLHASDADGPPLVLVYANRNPAAAAWLAELERLAAEWGRFSLLQLLEEGADAADRRALAGRIRESVLAPLLAEHGDADFYVVGPDPMVEATSLLLGSLGVPPERVVAESFYGY